ncbi:MAG TPA: BolA/IbaG family iron-sulfur metabolism protein [Candidatus Binatia bacterium]
MMNPEEIESVLKQALAECSVNVQDLTGGGDHFQVLVISSDFEGKSLVEQHQLVYAALKEHMGSERIHALALKTLTPAQWERVGSASG